MVKLVESYHRCGIFNRCRVVSKEKINGIEIISRVDVVAFNHNISNNFPVLSALLIKTRRCKVGHRAHADDVSFSLHALLSR